MKKPWKTYLLWILLSEAVGGLPGWLTREGTKAYSRTIVQPPLSPPGWVFPVVWTILFALMGIGAFLLLNYGRYLGLSPAWFCEGLAFSLFGLVFMRENGMAAAGKQSRKAAQPDPDDSFGSSDEF